jgi:hypothetical protein
MERPVDYASAHQIDVIVEFVNNQVSSGHGLQLRRLLCGDP